MLKIVIGVIISAFLMGCIESPLLNHVDASSKRSLNPLIEDPSCPLLFSRENLCASIVWDKMPNDEEKGEFTLRFWSRSMGTESGPYASPTQDVFIKLWMPGMGHGSSPVTVKAEVDPFGVVVSGVFRASDIYFVMPGAWEIWVQLRSERAVMDQAKIDVQI